MGMLDRFFDWWPLVALLSIGGIAQMLSSLWPRLKGKTLVGAVLTVFAILFGVWVFAAPQHHATAGVAFAARAIQHHAHRTAAVSDR